MEKKIDISNHIKIKSRLPAFGTDRLFKRLKKVESRSMHGQLPIAWKSAKDFYTELAKDTSVSTLDTKGIFKDEKKIELHFILPMSGP